MSKKRLVAREIARGELDEYESLAKECGCLFDSSRWTGLFGAGVKHVGVFDGGDNLRGGFCWFEERRFGLRVVRNPPFTRQVGPFFDERAKTQSAKTTEQRAVVKAMAEFINEGKWAVVSLGLSYGISDGLPFYWSGYKVVPHYTYRIDLRQTEAEILKQMSMRHRNHIRKAEKDGLVVAESDETETLRALVFKTYARQQKKFPVAAMDRILQSFTPQQGAVCLICRRDDVPIAGVYFVHDASTAYNILTGYDHTLAHHGAGTLAMYKAIMRARELGLRVFDFEGSVLPAVEPYFRGFGGTLEPILSVHKAWLPFELGLKAVRRNFF